MPMTEEQAVSIRISVLCKLQLCIAVNRYQQNVPFVSQYTYWVASHGNIGRMYDMQEPSPTTNE